MVGFASNLDVARCARFWMWRLPPFLDGRLRLQFGCCSLRSLLDVEADASDWMEAAAFCGCCSLRTLLDVEAAASDWMKAAAFFGWSAAPPIWMLLAALAVGC
jgi:hypothetical protein